jgi:DNA-3-methyladenine glycosylase I
VKDAPASTELAISISKQLKKRGFKFVGPTMVYAFMQTAGFVNDHCVDCFRFVRGTQSAMLHCD